MRRGIRRRDATARLAAGDVGELSRQLRESVEVRGGEESARERAAALADWYADLDEDARRTFLSLLASELAVSPEVAGDAARSILNADPTALSVVVDEARSALTAPWVKLLTALNMLPNGARFLIDLRADLLRFNDSDRSLVPLERDLRSLLAGWFDIGFLRLRQITWDSPASLLEKLALSEAVHEVSSWVDLKNRLEPDRRFFAFFHLRMPDDPLIFVEVALVSGVVRDIGSLLDTHAPLLSAEDADTAIFYSISNVEPGLAGISFGGFLIRDVVSRLQAELPRLRTFATLSPLPGFRDWLTGELEAGGSHLRDGDAEALAALAGTDEPPPESQRERLLRLCADYLLNAKRSDGRPLDSVANFHLSNGARVERINWAADASPQGLRASFGLMVNYLYDLRQIEANHDAFVGRDVISASADVLRLAHDATGSTSALTAGVERLRRARARR